MVKYGRRNSLWKNSSNAKKILKNKIKSFLSYKKEKNVKKEADEKKILPNHK